MANEQRKYPETVAGLYKNKYDSTLNSMELSQERADQICAAIQKCVGGKLSLKEVRAETKKEKGDKFPDYFLEGVTAEILAERKAFGAQKKAERENSTAVNTAGDDSL